MTPGAADPVHPVRCRIVTPVTIEDSTTMAEAFFTVDGDLYLPGVMARGPWGAAMCGHIVGGLLGWGIEQSGVDPHFQPARLTVDPLRPVLLEPVVTDLCRRGFCLSASTSAPLARM
jgi:hypothetical protein